MVDLVGIAKHGMTVSEVVYVAPCLSQLGSDMHVGQRKI